MNDEIKEILKCMKNYGSTTELALLDYITNLQKENERLKELNENYPIEEELAEAYRREEDYKSRIEKALLIIEKQKKKMYKSRNKIAMFILIKLDNILNGRSDE